jgi:uncharacterized protein (TIGR02118 family)
MKITPCLNSSWSFTSFRRCSEEFRRHLREVHGPLAKKLPGLKRYLQNFPVPDSKRKAPPWDAVIELYFENRPEMEAAWASPQGAASDADLPLFADLGRTSWSVVDEITP